jgi:hypothetical protein
MNRGSADCCTQQQVPPSLLTPTRTPDGDGHVETSVLDRVPIAVLEEMQQSIGIGLEFQFVDDLEHYCRCVDVLPGFEGDRFHSVQRLLDLVERLFRVGLSNDVEVSPRDVDRIVFRRQQRRSLRLRLRIQYRTL